MTVSVGIHRISRATHQSITERDDGGDCFDAVRIATDEGAVTLFLPFGTGQSVAAAINAAVSPAIAEAAE